MLGWCLSLMGIVWGITITCSSLVYFFGKCMSFTFVIVIIAVLSFVLSKEWHKKAKGRSESRILALVALVFLKVSSKQKHYRHIQRMKKSIEVSLEGIFRVSQQVWNRLKYSEPKKSWKRGLQTFLSIFQSCSEIEKYCWKTEKYCW